MILRHITLALNCLRHSINNVAACLRVRSITAAIAGREPDRTEIRDSTEGTILPLLPT